MQKNVIIPNIMEKATQVDTTISRMANFARITNSKQVARINEETTPYALEKTFFFI